MHNFVNDLRKIPSEFMNFTDFIVCLSKSESLPEMVMLYLRPSIIYSHEHHTHNHEKSCWTVNSHRVSHLLRRSRHIVNLNRTRVSCICFDRQTSLRYWLWFRNSCPGRPFFSPECNLESSTFLPADCEASAFSCKVSIYYPRSRHT